MSKQKKLGKRDKRELVLMKDLAKGITRDELTDILDGVADQRLQMFLGMMHDPAHSNKSLAKIARECNVTFVELAEIIRKNRVAEGMIRMTAHVPAIMQGVAEDALPGDEVCGKCEGVGTVIREQLLDVQVAEGEQPRKELQKIPVKCVYCKGEGRIKKSGDPGARKLVFEAIGLTGKQGPLVAVQNNTLNVGDEDDVEAVLKLTQRQAQLPQVVVTQVKEGE
jgi:hypothetical protein